MSLYDLNAEMDWQNRTAKILLVGTGTVPSNLAGYLIDNEGQPVTRKISMSTQQDIGMSYGELPLYISQELNRSFGLSGWANNSGEASSADTVFANSGYNLPTKADHLNGNTIQFLRGDNTRDYEVSAINNYTISIDESTSYNASVDIREGDIVYSTGTTRTFYVVSGSVSETEGGIVVVQLDRDVDTVSVGHSVVVCPGAVIDDYEANIGSDAYTKIVFGTLTDNRRSSISGSMNADYPSVTSGANFHDMFIDPAALQPGKEFAVGDYVHISDDSFGNRYYTEIISKLSHTGFIVSDAFGISADINGAVQIYRQEEFLIDRCPLVGEQMHAIVEDATTTQKLVVDAVPLGVPQIEMNFNEYDSAVSSVGTLSHFHLGPISVNGINVVNGLERVTATLYANDQTSIASWTVDYYDTYEAAGDREGMYFDSTRGIFVLTTTRTFAQADMLTLSATFKLNGQSLTKAITIAALPVV